MANGTRGLPSQPRVRPAPAATKTFLTQSLGWMFADLLHHCRRGSPDPERRSGSLGAWAYARRLYIVIATVRAGIGIGYPSRGASLAGLGLFFVFAAASCTRASRSVSSLYKVGFVITSLFGASATSGRLAIYGATTKRNLNSLARFLFMGMMACSWRRSSTLLGCRDRLGDRLIGVVVSRRHRLRRPEDLYGYYAAASVEKARSWARSTCTRLRQHPPVPAPDLRQPPLRVRPPREPARRPAAAGDSAQATIRPRSPSIAEPGARTPCVRPRSAPKPPGHVGRWTGFSGLTGTTGTPPRRRSARDEQTPRAETSTASATGARHLAQTAPLARPRAKLIGPSARSAGVSPIIAVLAGGTRVAWQSATSIAGSGLTPTPSSPQHEIDASSPSAPSPRSVASVGTRSSVVATAITPRVPPFPEQFRQIRPTAPPKRPDPARTRAPRPPSGPPGRCGRNAGRAPATFSRISPAVVATADGAPASTRPLRGIEPDCREEIPRHPAAASPPPRRAEASRARPVPHRLERDQGPVLVEHDEFDTIQGRVEGHPRARRGRSGYFPAGRYSISCRGANGEARRSVRSGGGDPGRQSVGLLVDPLLRGVLVGASVLLVMASATAFWSSLVHVKFLINVPASPAARQPLRRTILFRCTAGSRRRPS